MLEGSLLGEGGARNAAGCGFGARFFAGEKCCWRVENAGFLICGGSTFEGRGAGSSDGHEGGRRAVAVEALKVEYDLFLVWPIARVLEERVLLVDALRRCRDCVTGGRERSCFTGSVFEAGLPLRLLVEGRLCNSVVAGLPTFARVDGGFIEGLWVMLPLEMGGCESVEVLRVVTVGRRLGDWLLLSAAAGRRMELLSLESTFDLLYLLPFSAGLRSERVREGIVDMAAMLFIDSRMFGARSNKRRTSVTPSQGCMDHRQIWEY